MKDTNTIGSITETKILLWCIENNISVSLPYDNKKRYDQIWDVNGKLLRIQIKTARIKDKLHEAIEFNCYSVSNGKKHNYTKKEIDYFAVWFDNEVYLIPVEECGTSSKKIRFADSLDKVKYASKTNWAENYKAKVILNLV